MSKLKAAATSAKHALSAEFETTIELDNLFGGEDLSVTISRALFEDLCAPLFQRLTAPLEDALNQSGLKKSEIDEVLLVGGSTRIPAVQKKVTDFFGKEPSKGVNPDEAVAFGAAVQGSILAGDNEEEVVLVDVNALSLGIGIRNGLMSFMIRRNSKIPMSAVNRYTTSTDNQKHLVLRLFEGESPLTENNHLLGEFNVTGIPPAKRGDPTIEVTLEIDASGIITMSAEVKDTGTRGRLQVEPKGNRLSEEECEEAIARAHQSREQEKVIRKARRAQNRLERYLRDVRSGIETGRVRLNTADRNRCLTFVKDALSWVAANAKVEEPQAFSGKLTEALAFLEPVIGDYAAPEDEDGDDNDEL